MVRIEVEDEGGEGPEVLDRVAGRAAGDALRAPQRGELDREIAPRFGPVVGVVDLAEESRMDDGDVIALEVVVDVDLPVAVEGPLLMRGEPEPAIVAARQHRHEIAEEVDERRHGG